MVRLMYVELGLLPPDDDVALHELTLEPANDYPANGGSCPGKKEEEAEGVGKKTGGKEQQSTDEDQRSLKKWTGRESALCHFVSDPAQNGEPL